MKLAGSKGASKIFKNQAASSTTLLDYEFCVFDVRKLASNLQRADPVSDGSFEDEIRTKARCIAPYST